MSKRKHVEVESTPSKCKDVKFESKISNTVDSGLCVTNDSNAPTVVSSQSISNANRERVLQFEGIETPAILLYTKRGAVPYLTADLLNLFPKQFGLHFPVAEMLGYPGSEVLKQYDGTLHSYIGLPESIIFADIRDYVVNGPGVGSKKCYAAETHTGKVRITPSVFMKFIEASRPNFFATLSDHVSGFASRSRAHKSVERSLKWIDECIRIRENFTLSKDVGNKGNTIIENQNKGSSLPRKLPLIFASIEGGMHPEKRKYYAQEMGKRSVDGFLISGLGCGEPPSERCTLIKTILDNISSHQIDKPRIISGLGRPIEIIKAVECGIDLFTTSYPYQLALLGYASTYALHPGSAKNKICDKINLRDCKYADDTRSLLAGCECMVCQKHTRAYIHHLLNVHEMLGHTLLSLHNVHHCLCFMSSIRVSIHKGTFAQYKKQFMQQYKIPTQY